MDAFERLFDFLRSDPPSWPIWQAPELGLAWLVGASYEGGSGFDRVRLSYHRPADLRQAIIESRVAPPPDRTLYWYLQRLEEATDATGIEEIFSPAPREFDPTGAEGPRVTASLAGSVAEGTTLRLGRSSVSTFVTPGTGNTVVFLRRGYPLDAAMPEFVPLNDLSSAQAERRKVLDELRANG